MRTLDNYFKPSTNRHQSLHFSNESVLYKNYATNLKIVVDTMYDYHGALFYDIRAVNYAANKQGISVWDRFSVDLAAMEANIDTNFPAVAFVYTPPLKENFLRKLFAKKSKHQFLSSILPENYRIILPRESSNSDFNFISKNLLDLLHEARCSLEINGDRLLIVVPQSGDGQAQSEELYSVLSRVVQELGSVLT